MYSAQHHIVASGEASAPAGSPHDRPHQRRPFLFLPSPSPNSGRRRVMSLGRPPLPSFGSLNLDGPPPSPPPLPPSPTASPPPTSAPTPVTLPLPSATRTSSAATEEDQQIIDQLHEMSRMLKDSACEDSLARQEYRLWQILDCKKSDVYIFIYVSDVLNV